MRIKLEDKPENNSLFGSHPPIMSLFLDVNVTNFVIEKEMCIWIDVCV